VAGPVRDGHVKTTNLAWPVDQASLARVLGLASVRLINDLAANAYGIAELAPDDLGTLNPGVPAPGGAAVVISAGTGLGEAGILPDGGGVRVIPTEGGHTDFGPRSGLEVELYRYLAAEDSHVSYERVCSGMGLWNIYRFLRARSRAPEPPWLTAELAAQILPKLRDGTFIGSFAAKGRFAELLGQVPVQVILNDRTALLGAAHCARQRRDS
jgi:glucokinase